MNTPRDSDLDAVNPYQSPRSEAKPKERDASHTDAFITPIETSVVALIIGTLAIALLPASNLTRAGYGLLPPPSEIGVTAYFVLSPLAALPVALGIGFTHGLLNRLVKERAGRKLLGWAFCCLAMAVRARALGS